jgi:hypothetical protein
VNPGNLEVRIVIDHTFTDPVCDCCVGFLKFKVEGEKPRVETAAPAGKVPQSGHDCFWHCIT